MKSEIELLQKKANKLQELMDKFPDLNKYQNRWKDTFLYSKKVNAIATNYDLIHGCGCCNDSPLYIKPYLVHNGEKIYSDPVDICVGERHYSYLYENWYDDWEERLKKHNISDKVISDVRKTVKKDKKRMREGLE